MRKQVLVVVAIIIAALTVGYIIKELSTDKNAKVTMDKNTKVTIIQYEYGTLNEIKRISINSSEDLAKVNTFIKKLKPLSENEMVDLALGNEIVIQYNDNISIRIQLEEKDYCYYENKEEDISSLSYMPNGLYEWINEKLK